MRWRVLVTLMTMLVISGCGGEHHPSSSAVKRPATRAAAPPSRPAIPSRTPRRAVDQESTLVVSQPLPLDPHPPVTTSLALDRRGRGLVGVLTRREHEDACDGVPFNYGYVATRAANGRLGRPRSLHLNLVAGPVRLRDGHFVALVGRFGEQSKECGANTVLWFATLAADGHIVRRTVITQTANVGPHPTLVAGAHGGALAAWLDQEHGQVRVASLTGDRVEHHTIVLATRADTIEGPHAVALAAEPDQGYLIAWADAEQAFALDLDAAGRPVDHGSAVGRTTADLGDIAVAAAHDGSAVIAYSCLDDGEEVNAPLDVFATTRPTRTAGFSKTARLTSGGADDIPPPGLYAAVAAGRALVAWANIAGDELQPPGEYDEVLAALPGREQTVDFGRAAGDIGGARIGDDGAALIALTEHGNVVFGAHPAGAGRWTLSALGRGSAPTLSADGLVTWQRPLPHGRLAVHVARIS